VAQLGIGEGITRLFCDGSIAVLLRLLPRWVIWPAPGSIEYEQMRSGVEQGSGLPECVGFLDETDIMLQHSRSYHGETYFNRKKQYGLNIQAICDSNTRFTLISGGYPASVGDATLYSSTSSIKQCYNPLFRGDTCSKYPIVR